MRSGSETDENSPAQRFRRFTVIAKRPENSFISSFILKPENSADWCRFLPGQFLSLKIKPANSRPLLRNYSVSSDPEEVGTYRITVKRESAPSAGIPDGVGSSLLHDQINPGDTLEIIGPRGNFILDETSKRSLVLLSGGVGITPLVSMLYVAARQVDRKIYFIHACRDGQAQVLADEIKMIAATNANIHIHNVFQNPTEADRQARSYQFEGLVDSDCLKSILPPDDYDCYLCGPAPFMQFVYDRLRDMNIPDERIAYEFFGPTKILERSETK